MSANQFETTLMYFGYQQDGIFYSRGTAQKVAETLVGTQSVMFEGHNGERARMTSYRLEDDTPDGSKGRVIGICEPVSVPVQNWKPGPTEVK